MKKIGILYICTGKYIKFWSEFYKSSEKNFLRNTEKHYFVFTDAPEVEFENENSKIHKIFQENLGWPNNTLKRYTIFLKYKELYSDFDYLVFLNANLQFVSLIQEDEFLPSEGQSLIACIHPGYFNCEQKEFPLEQRGCSTAYLSQSLSRFYFAGGINGGVTKSFIGAITQINDNIIKDENQSIVAKWHDESHWNRYTNTNFKHYKILTPSFLLPEKSKIPFIPKIIVRDKKLLGGHANLRNSFELMLLINSIKQYLKERFDFKILHRIKIQGGLGNQLFQYAHGRNLELKGKKIVFDTSFFNGSKSDNDTNRYFRLDKFRIGTIAKFESNSRKESSIHNKILKLLLPRNEEFFQNEKYFERNAFFIRQEFSLAGSTSEYFNTVASDIDEQQCPVSIHIRRGDYVKDPKTNAFHGVCNQDYYTNAQEILSEKINTDKISLFIFSDDIEWVKNNMRFKRPACFVSSPNLKDYEELTLMSKCKHNIIANSTFSWWGAWLNKNPEKIIIAPKRWFAKSNKNICPKDWIRI